MCGLNGWPSDEGHLPPVKRLWLFSTCLLWPSFKSLFWLPASVRRRLYVRGKTWHWTILQTFEMLSQRDAVKTEMAKSTLASTGKYSILFCFWMLCWSYCLFCFLLRLRHWVVHTGTCMLKKLALFCSQGEKSGQKKVIAYINFKCYRKESGCWWKWFVSFYMMYLFYFIIFCLKNKC